MSRRRDNEDARTREPIPSEEDGSREAQLDEALEDTFPASDPVSVEHSDHAGVPPNHSPTAEKGTPSDRKPD
jgi:hypothetical protein